MTTTITRTITIEHIGTFASIEDLASFRSALVDALNDDDRIEHFDITDREEEIDVEYGVACETSEDAQDIAKGIEYAVWNGGSW